MVKRKTRTKTLVASGKRIRSTISFGVSKSRIRASAGANGKVPTLDIVAYQGGKISPSGINSECVIDLQGTRFDNDQTIILENHKTDRDHRIGHATAQRIIPHGHRLEGKTGPLIDLKAVASAKSLATSQLVKDAKGGFPFQASVGGEIKAAVWIARGETAVVNGTRHQGPFLHIKKFVIREVSVVPLGADSSTSTRVAAKAKLSENTAMTFAHWLKQMGMTEKGLSASQRKAMFAQYKTMKTLQAKVASATKEDDEDRPRRTKAGTKTRVKAENRRVKAFVGGRSREVDPDDDDDDDDDFEGNISAHRRRLLDETDRQDAIRAATANFEDADEDVEIRHAKKKYSLSAFQRYALRSGMSADAYELTVRRQALPTMPRGPAIHVQNKDVKNDALVASICRASGMEEDVTNKFSGKKYGLVHYFNEKTLEASHQPQYQINGSIQALLDMQIRAAGGYYASAYRGNNDFLAQAWEASQSMRASRQMVQASGFSSLNIQYVLENVMNKTALAAFQSAEGVWREFVAVSSVKDFRPAVQYALDLSGSYKKVATDGELKHVGMIDTKFSIQADTYGAMIAVDRKTLKNDDLGVILTQAMGIGMLGAQRIEESIFVLWLSNPSSFYAAGNKNYISGGSSALSITSLETARSTFRKQVINGKPVQNGPDRILTGTALEVTARKIYKDAGYTVATGTSGLAYFDSNEFQNKYRPIVSPWLDNTDITDQDGAAITGQSATKWALFCPPGLPQGASVKIAFVDGRQVPYFDQADTQFNIPGGIQFRSYLDWGVAMGRTQMSLLSAGA